MRIAINTRLLVKGKMDGIGWFTYETTRRIVEAHPQILIGEMQESGCARRCDAV